MGRKKDEKVEGSMKLLNKAIDNLEKAKRALRNGNMTAFEDYITEVIIIVDESRENLTIYNPSCPY